MKLVLKKVTSVTNENMISSQKELNSSFIDIDVLIETSNQLIDSLNTINEIKESGRQKVLENHKTIISLQEDFRKSV